MKESYKEFLKERYLDASSNYRKHGIISIVLSLIVSVILALEFKRIRLVFIGFATFLVIRSCIYSCLYDFEAGKWLNKINHINGKDYNHNTARDKKNNGGYSD